jgi:hypothetical protein
MSDVLPKWLHHIDEEDIKKLLQSEKGVIRQFAQWVSEPSKVIALQNEVARLAQENLRLRTVMLAAHQEITEHWESHCDDEGYGPQSLVRHLKEGTGFYPGFVDEASKKGGGDVP